MAKNGNLIWIGIAIIFTIMIFMKAQEKKEAQGSTNLQYLIDRCEPNQNIWQCTTCTNCYTYCRDTASGLCTLVSPECGYTTKVYDCDTGKPPPSTCTDSDNTVVFGDNSIYVKGSVTFAGATYADYCISSNTLGERACDSSSGSPSVVTHTINCAGGCDAGICKNTGGTPGGETPGTGGADFSNILPWIIGGAALLIGLKMMNKGKA